MSPFPKWNDEGVITWENAGFSTSPGSAIVPGQKIGLAIHYLPEYQAWSLLGERMFGVIASEDPLAPVVSFQQWYGECVDFPVPVDLEGLSIGQVASVLGACSDEFAVAAAQRKDYMWGVWGPGTEAFKNDPAMFVGATCMSNPDPPKGQCTKDGHCLGMQICVDGLCVEP